MLPGKTYRPEDILNILRKRFWVVVLPWAVIAAGTAAVARKLPDMYRSFAMIQVTPPKVPANIVQQNPVRLQDRLQATTQTILSRTRLEGLIQEFNLYEEDRKKHKIMEDVIGSMRDDIHVDPSKGDTFIVSYVGRVPSTVLKVTEKLAGYFKDENAIEGQKQAEGTSNFVESQVEEAHRKLVAVETLRTQYQMAHVGELPEQLTANMQAVQNINQQLASLAQQNNIDANAKATLEREIAQYEGMGDPGTAPLPAGADPSTGTAAQRLAAAKAQLADMLEVRRMKPENPDVKIMQNAIKGLQAQADAEALKGPVGAGAASPAEQQRLARIAGWKEDLERVKQQIQANKAEEQRLKTAAATYQGRIDRVPTRQAELVNLNRDYDALNKIYLDLIGTRERSSMSVNLESRQMGEQFVLLDAARMPERPYSPNRTMINFLGIMGGLAVGLALVALIEYRDTTFKTDTELAAVLALPVLAVVPAMRSEPERRADFRRTLIMNVGFASVTLVCLAVLTYSFVFPH